MIKLSIIIPCYNAEPYIRELLECIDKQITDEVEVVLVDDGSKEPIHSKYQTDFTWLKIYRQENKGISAARNRGLEAAKGKFIWFIDADDLISDNAIAYVINKIDNQEFDYMDLSWKSLEDNKYTFKLNSDSDSLPNPSASTRVFKRSFIGDIRFNTRKDTAEDEDFTRHIGIKNAKHVCATEYIYYYRTTTPGSKYKMFLENRTKTKRIGYYFKKVTKDMTYLIDEIKKLDEIHEVMLFTYDNQLPELEKYCQIRQPAPIRVSQMHGEPNNFMKLVPITYDTQVVIYKSNIGEIGGIETFIYSFCKQMSKYYDITVVYDAISDNQLARLVEICPVVKNDPNNIIYCDTLILNSILDKRPQNIKSKKTVQMAHCLKQGGFTIPQDRDVIVNVSQASKDSFGEEAEKGIVINNLSVPEKTPKALLLVSALRVGAKDKQGNDERCIQLARMLDKAGIKYIWMYFGSRPMACAPENMVYCGSRTNMKPYIKMADYYVCLSGAEAFSYSLLEALETNTPVLVTPLAQNKEMGIVDSKNGYVIPYDVEMFDVKKILRVPKFHYKHDNEKIINQWCELLGDTKPKHDYKPKKEVQIIVTTRYFDIQLDETLEINDKRTMKLLRALELQGKGFVRILN